MPRAGEIGWENLAAAIAGLTAGNGVFFGLGLGFVAVTSWSRSRHSARALEKVESTQVTPLADVKSLLGGQSKDGNSSGSGAESGQASPGESTFAIVRGEVQPRGAWRLYGSQDEVPLKSEFVPEEASKCVITRKLQTFQDQRYLRLKSEVSGKRTGVRARRIGWEFPSKRSPNERPSKTDSFCPERPRARDARVHVDWQGSPKDWLPLECTYRHFQPGAASGTQAFVFLVFGQSCPVGVVTEERVLKVGTELTAIGNVVKVGDALSIRPAESMPLFLTKMNKDQIVEALKIDGLVHRWTGNVTGIIAGSIFAYAAGRLCFRIYKEWRRRRSLYRNPRPPPNAAGSAPQPSSANASELAEADDPDDVAPPGEACVVCLTRTRRAVFLNCGHRAACFQCAQRVAERGQKVCPLCRQPIVGVVRVYDP